MTLQIVMRKLAKPVLLVAGVAVCTLARGAEVYLRSGVITNTMANGSNVVMWGFAQDSAFGARDGRVTAPGPTLNIPPGDTSLTIHLDNHLPEPVSIVIPGQTIAPTPVRLPNGRARSFTIETPPGNVSPVNYTWSNLRPGTFLYRSGTHPSVQVQMGLYGCLRKDVASGQTYTGVVAQGEVTLLYSEIDPALHNAVATGNYGPGLAMSSTVDYAPKYFLINGQSYTNGLAPATTVRPGDTLVLHFLNAGLKTHVPIVNNAFLRLIAEDGFPYPYPKDQYSVFLPAGKTIDALYTSSVSNQLAIYDRRMDMVNSATTAGGMLTYLKVGQPPPITAPPLSWLMFYYGAGPYPTNLLHDYIAGLNPTDPTATFDIRNMAAFSAQSRDIYFSPTITGRYYSLDYRTNLLTGTWDTIRTNVPGSPGTMFFSDVRTDNTGFYRIRVDLP